MAHLSMNPEGHMVRDGRTLAEVVANDEYLDPEKHVEEKEEKKEKKMKFLSFELDMKYPRTLRGFVRTIQILLLLVSFVCLIITSWGDAQGAYTFYCIVLIFAALVGGFVFFTILTGSRSGPLCGLSWVKVELVYFILFGFLVFIGACLAASNNSTGNPALNAGAAFGFLACITFAAYIYWTWQDYKNPPDDEEDKDDENKEEKEKEEDPENGLDSITPNGVPGPRIVSQRRRGSLIDPPHNVNGDLRIDPPMNRDNNFRKSKQGRRFPNEEHAPLGGQISVISHNEITDPGLKQDKYYRRQRSGSDKDSAYSEGSMNERDRSLPTKIRRSASMREDRARGSVKNPRHHMTDRRMHNSPGRRPRQLSAQELMNEDSPKRKSVPSWLKAALEDDDPEIHRLLSTMPAVRRKNEFPLLHTSDEESVAYPSVSQTLANHQPVWNNRHAGRAYRENSHHIRREHNHTKHGRNNVFHGPHHRGNKRLHAHGHRQLQGHGKRHAHGHGQNRGHHRHIDRHGRIGQGHQRGRQNIAHGRVRPQDNAFLRRMVENDTLVDHRGDAVRIQETKRTRQKLHETPSSLHFPDRSRWDDNGINMPERGVTKTMIENYLESD